MSSEFPDITFTNSEKATQSLYDSRESIHRLELTDNTQIEHSEFETAFIAERGGFIRQPCPNQASLIYSTAPRWAARFSQSVE